MKCGMLRQAFGLVKLMLNSLSKINSQRRELYLHFTFIHQGCCILTYLLMPLDSLWNKGPQQHPSSELDSGWSSLARPMLFRRLLSRHRCFSAKSASGDRPYASLADSSQGLAWLCWMQAFVACGLSNPTCTL